MTNCYTTVYILITTFAIPKCKYYSIYYYPLTLILTHKLDSLITHFGSEELICQHLGNHFLQSFRSFLCNIYTL